MITLFFIEIFQSLLYKEEIKQELEKEEKVNYIFLKNINYILQEKKNFQKIIN